MNSHIASRSKRFFAYLIDSILIAIPVTIIFIVFFDFGTTFTNYMNRGDAIEPRAQFLQERNWIRNISFLIWIIYSFIMEASPRQATLGKQMMKIKVINIGGGPLNLQDSFYRNFSKILSYLALSLGFIWILFDKHHQGWHDKIAKTIVVDNLVEPSLDEHLLSSND